MERLRCRSCDATVERVLVDLGVSPLSNRFLGEDDLHRMEPTYPLKVRVCTACWLVQLPVLVDPIQIFTDYPYFSSYSDSWVRHCERYAQIMTERLGLGSAHRVVEIASNDGTLLRFFQRSGVSVMGVEPAVNVAAYATRHGIPTLVRFFGKHTAEEMVADGLSADLLLGNNVLAHVPDINDFIAGMKVALKPGGVVTMEFPHLMRLIESNQFDTIYHEHFSYLSFIAVETAFRRHGLEVFDVDELTTHGGSLRIYARHENDTSRPVTANVMTLRSVEMAKGYASTDVYDRFSGQVEEAKRAFLTFLIEAKRTGKRIAGYGAPAKGNTLLNYCGVRTDFIDFTVDRSEHKQGRWLPGSRIPIYHPDRVRHERPDYLIILPWNIREEVIEQMSYVRDWGCRFVVPVPHIEIIE
jgi:SAM-dependent methyltransferase